MQIQPHLTPLPTALPQAAEPASLPGTPNGGFAQLMAHTRSGREAAATPEASDDGERAEAAESADTPDAADAPASTRPDEGRAARLRQAARPARAAQVEAKPAAKEAAAGDATAEQGDTPVAAPEGVPMDPALAQWLAHLHLPPADAAAPKSEAAGSMAVGEAAAGPAPLADADACGPGRLGRPAGDAAAAQNARSSTHPVDRAVEPADRESPAGASASALRVADEAVLSSPTAEREPVAAPAPQAFTLPAGFEAATAAAAARAEASATAATTAATVAVPVPLDSPDFAQAFGVQVSVLARDGVQEARLHLNPAEMGPVSVQIAMDGERARIDFGAQAAATRAAIEASLPELAAALREAGLTLSGGGVSQHAPGRGDSEPGHAPDAPASGRERADAAAAGTNARPAWRARVAAGGVDLYA